MENYQKIMYYLCMKGLKAPNPPTKEKQPLLLEILVGFALFLMVAVIVYMILNPHKDQEETRNSMRSQSIVEIAAAVKNYVDTTGNLPKEIPLNRECASIGNEICQMNATDCAGMVQLNSVIETGFLTQIPVDELKTSGNGSGYYISHDGDGNIMICAPLAERSVEISLKQFVY